MTVQHNAVIIGPEGNWPDTVCMAALGDSLFVVASRSLWRQVGEWPDAAPVGPLDNWPDAKCMAAHDGQLYIVASSTLWRQAPDGSPAEPVGPADNWPNATCMAAHDGQLYIVASNTLWRQAPDGSPAEPVGPAGNWPNATCMGAHDGSLYIIASEALWRQLPDGSNAQQLGPDNNWPNATCMTVRDGLLYVIASDALWSQTLDEAPATLLAAEDTWPLAPCMANLDGRLYIISESNLLRLAEAIAIAWETNTFRPRIQVFLEGYYVKSGQEVSGPTRFTVLAEQARFWLDDITMRVDTDGAGIIDIELRPNRDGGVIGPEDPKYRPLMISAMCKLSFAGQTRNFDAQLTTEPQGMIHVKDQTLNPVETDHLVTGRRLGSFGDRLGLCGMARVDVPVLGKRLIAIEIDAKLDYDPANPPWPLPF